MRKLRIIQIGDVHFPDNAAKTLADIKDRAFPDIVLSRVTQKPMQSVVREIQAQLEKQKCHAIILCGDLTSRGDTNGYRDCAKYLFDALNLRKWKIQQIHAVPGNHDVDRAQIDPKGEDLFNKFAGFKVAWEDLGLPILAVETFRKTNVSSGNACHAAIFSLNSSVGCGERRHLPAQIATQLEDLLKGHTSKVGLKAAFNLVGETLDTPAFLQDDVDGICREIKGLDSKILPILVSHHNVLPQSLFRLELYTELLNSGMARSRLSRLQRPIIYCHGHVHDDPLEIIQEPLYQGSHVVFLSAPELTRGFNLLEIEFGSRGLPLGCRVFTFQLDINNGDVRAREIRAPFYALDHVDINRLGGPDLPRLLSTLTRRELRLPDLKDRMAATGAALTDLQLADLLTEAEWLGVVQLINRQESPQYWCVKGVSR